MGYSGPFAPNEKLFGESTKTSKHLSFHTLPIQKIPTEHGPSSSGSRCPNPFKPDPNRFSGPFEPTKYPRFRDAVPFTGHRLPPCRSLGNLQSSRQGSETVQSKREPETKASGPGSSLSDSSSRLRLVRKDEGTDKLVADEVTSIKGRAPGSLSMVCKVSKCSCDACVTSDSAD